MPLIETVRNARLLACVPIVFLILPSLIFTFAFYIFDAWFCPQWNGQQNFERITPLHISLVSSSQQTGKASVKMYEG